MNAILFEREDWELFRRLPTLAQKAGVAVSDLAAVVAKELADNALDASGTCRYGLLDGNGFFVEDDGPGLPGGPVEVAALFSIRRPLTSSKLLRLPTRGALGNGLRVVAGTVFATGGTLRVITAGQIHDLEPRDDGSTWVVVTGTEHRKGTRIEVRFGPTLHVTERTLRWASFASALSESGEDYKGRTSPYWYDVDAIHDLLRAAGDRPVRDVVAHLDGCSGAKAGQVARAFLGRAANTLSRDEALTLLSHARGYARCVNVKRIGRVGPRPDMCDGYAIADGTLRVSGIVLPYVIEAWVTLAEPTAAHGDDALTLIPGQVCVNKTPITAQVRIVYNRKDRTIDLFGCGLHHDAPCGRARPTRVVVNIQTPYMPITSDGKEPDLVLFLAGLRAALEKAVARAKHAQKAERQQEAACAVSDADASTVARLQDAARRHLGRTLQPKTLVLWQGILTVLEQYERIRVRAMAYRLSDMKVIAKTPAEFRRVGTALTDMRRAGVVPYETIVEGHRERVKIDTYADLANFMIASKTAIIAISGKHSPITSRCGLRRMASGILSSLSASATGSPTLPLRGKHP